MSQVQDLKLSIGAIINLLKQDGHLSPEHLADIKQKGMNGKAHPATAIQSYQFKSAINQDVKLDEEFIMG